MRTIKIDSSVKDNSVYVKLIDRRRRRCRQFTVRGATPAQLEKTLLQALRAARREQKPVTPTAPAGAGADQRGGAP